MYYFFFQEYMRNVKKSKRSFLDMKWWEIVACGIMITSAVVFIVCIQTEKALYNQIWLTITCGASILAAGTYAFLYWHANHFNYRLAYEKKLKICKCRISALKDTLRSCSFQYYDLPHVEWLLEKTVSEITQRENVKKQCQKLCATVLGVIDVFMIYYIHYQLDNLAHIDVRIFLCNIILLTIGSIELYYGVTGLVNMVQIKKASLYTFKDDLDYLRAEMLSETKNGR